MNHQNGFVNIIIISVIAVIVIIGGYIILSKKPQLPLEPPVTLVTPDQPTPSVQPVSQNKQIHFIFPKGGEKLEIGDTYEISWENNSGKKPTQIIIHTFSQDGQDFGYGRIATSSTFGASDVKYKWTIGTNNDIKYKYKIELFSDSPSPRTLIGESDGYFTLTDIKPNIGDIIIDPKYIFEIGKSFAISGVLLPNNGFSPIYTNDNTLQKSIFQVRARQFWLNACDKIPDIRSCSFQGEQMVHLEFQAPQSRDVFLTNKSKDSSYLYDETGIKGGERIYDKYEVKLLSLNIQKKEAIIVIRKTGSIQLPDGIFPPIE